MKQRCAFTLVEVLLALVLASMVLAAMMGTLGVLMNADTVSSARVDAQTDLTITENLIRRVMVSLAAVAPMDPAQMRKVKAPTEIPAGSEPTPAQDQEGLNPMAPPDIDPMFDLYYADLGDGTAAPVLECVIMDPPGVLNPSAAPVTLDSFRSVQKGRTREAATLARRIAQSVRGRFEVGPTADKGWALQWRGIDPPSEPVTLLAGVSRVEWWVLPVDEKQREAQQTWSAKLASDFPISVRLELWTDDGQQFSWMFETEIQIINLQEPEPEGIPGTGDDADNQGTGTGTGEDAEGARDE